MVESHKHFMTFVRGTADRVAHDDDTEANINRVQHGGQHTNIRLRSRDNQRIRLTLAQVIDQPRFGEGGMARLVDNCGRRAKGGERRR